VHRDEHDREERGGEKLPQDDPSTANTRPPAGHQRALTPELQDVATVATLEQAAFA